MTMLKKAIKWYLVRSSQTYMWVPTGMVMISK
jgi:hypothetical protein